jgi:hypothetical protein
MFLLRLSIAIEGALDEYDQSTTPTVCRCLFVFLDIKLAFSSCELTPLLVCLDYVVQFGPQQACSLDPRLCHTPLASRAKASRLPRVTYIQDGVIEVLMPAQDEERGEVARLDNRNVIRVIWTELAFCSPRVSNSGAWGRVALPWTM